MNMLRPGRRFVSYHRVRTFVPRHCFERNSGYAIGALKSYDNLQKETCSSVERVYPVARGIGLCGQAAR